MPPGSISTKQGSLFRLRRVSLFHDFGNLVRVKVDLNLPLRLATVFGDDRITLAFCALEGSMFSDKNTTSRG